MRIVGIGNCLDGSNVIIVEDENKERFFSTDRTVIDIKEDSVLFYGDDCYTSVTELREI